MYDRDELDGNVESCGLCGGEAQPLGTLGKLTWYRCRDCGIDFNREES